MITLLAWAALMLIWQTTLQMMAKAAQIQLTALKWLLAQATMIDLQVAMEQLIALTVD